METNLKLKYTEPAVEAMAAAKDRYVRQLELSIHNEKYAPGDSIIEVTAADINRAAKNIVLIQRSSSSTLERLATLYFAVGICLATFSFLIDKIRLLISGSPVAAITLAAGVFLAFGSGLVLLQLRGRRRSIREFDEFTRYVNASGESSQAQSELPAQDVLPQDIEDAKIEDLELFLIGSKELTSIQRDERGKRLFKGKRLTLSLSVEDVSASERYASVTARRLERAKDRNFLIFVYFSKNQINKVVELPKNAKIEVSGIIDEIDDSRIRLEKAQLLSIISL